MGTTLAPSWPNRISPRPVAASSAVIDPCQGTARPSELRPGRPETATTDPPRTGVTENAAVSTGHRATCPSVVASTTNTPRLGGTTEVALVLAAEPSRYSRRPSGAPAIGATRNARTDDVESRQVAGPVGNGLSRRVAGFDGSGLRSSITRSGSTRISRRSPGFQIQTTPFVVSSSGSA